MKSEMTAGYNYEEPAELPSLYEVQAQLQLHQRIRIKHRSTTDNYFNTLFEELENHYVQRWADNSIVIVPSISTQQLSAREEQIHAAAQRFRQDATHLMRLMAAVFGFGLGTPDGLWKLRAEAKGAGQLNEQWQYRLHGAECRFENNQTGQVLEVVVITAPEFGALDSSFLHLYLQTTTEFRELAGWLGESHNVAKALEVLEPVMDWWRNLGVWQSEKVTPAT